MCPFLPGHGIYPCALLRRFLVLFCFLNTKRTSRVIGSAGLYVLKYPRETCHLLDSCFCLGTVSKWLSFHRDPHCTGQGFRQRDCPSLRALSHFGLSVWKGVMDGWTMPQLFHLLDSVLLPSLSSNTRLWAWEPDGKKTAIWGVPPLHSFLGHSWVSPPCKQ